jgi:hypothetical protein
MFVQGDTELLFNSVVDVIRHCPGRGCGQDWLDHREDSIWSVKPICSHFCE